MAGHLRPLLKDDLEVVLLWRNHPNIRRFMYSQHKIALSEHLAWYERTLTNDSIHLLMYELNGIPTGFVKLQVVDATSRRGDWGFYLSPDAPKGSGRLLGQSTIDYAFKQVGLHKLCGEVLEYNVKSLQFHERLGFKKEALFRDHFYDGHNYHNVVGFGLVVDDFTNNIALGDEK